MDQLVKCGGSEFAIGGLLKRKVNSARYSSAARTAHLQRVLSAIQERYPGLKLFVLGCYHPKRHRLFDEKAVFASDYKGWIFNYEHRINILDALHTELTKVERQSKCSRELTRTSLRRLKLANRAADVRRAMRPQRTMALKTLSLRRVIVQNSKSFAPNRYFGRKAANSSYNGHDSAERL